MPDFENVEAHYKRLGNSEYSANNTVQMCESKEVHDLIMADMKRLATENKLNSLEKPKKIHLCAKEF